MISESKVKPGIHNLFPIQSQQSIVKKQLLLAKLVTGMTPDRTDDMEFQEFEQYLYTEIEDLKKQQQKNA